MPKLKPKHEAALSYFLRGDSEAEAMRKAGYSKTTASKAPQLVFGREDVKLELERRQAKLREKNELNEEWVIKRWMKLADAGSTLAPYKVVQPDGTLAWDFTGATEEELALVSEIGVDFYVERNGEDTELVKKFKVKHPDSHQALMALSRHLGLFNDKLELTGGLAERIQNARNRFAVPEDEEQATVH